MFRSEILPFDEYVFNVVAAVGCGIVFIRSSQPDMFELKYRFQFVAVFAADIADALRVGLAFAYGEKMLCFFAPEQLPDIFVQARTVQHFIGGKIF